MSDAVLGYPRRTLARFALVAVLGVGGLASVPAALASPTSAIDLHVQRANVALRAAASASASGSTNITVPLSKVTEQLGIAAKLGVRLAVHARTPKTQSAGNSALNLIAGEEAQAQALLNAGVSATGASIVKADLAVTEGHALTLEELARLHGTTRVHANALLRTVANLKLKAGSLLGKLVLDTMPDTVGCPSAAVFAQFATKESSDIAGTLTADVAGGLANAIDAGGSLLASLTSDQAAQARARVNADLGCQPRDAGSGSAEGSQSGSGSDGGANTSGGANANGGAGVTGQVGVGAGETGQVGAGAGVTGQVGAGAGLGASGSTSISGSAGVSAGLGLGLGRWS